jgi:hypothetical protein
LGGQSWPLKISVLVLTVSSDRKNYVISKEEK